jgi:hypothetical protein
MRTERVKYQKYVDNLNRQCTGSFAASIMVEICKRAVLWSRIRSILVTRDLDLKSSNDAANKITLKKETPSFAYFRLFVRTLPTHFALLCWGGNGNT